MAIGFSNLVADIVNAGITSWKVRATNKTTGAQDDAYYGLGLLYDGKVNIEANTKPDSLKRNRANSYKLTVTAKLMFTGKTNMLKTLDALGSNRLNHKITLTNGMTISSALLTQTFFGFKWTFHSEADAEDGRFIDVVGTRNFLQSELATMLGAAPADGTPNATDLLYALNSLAESTDLIPAGATAVAVRPTGSGSYEDVGNFRNVKITAELLTSPDNLKREIGYEVKTRVEVEMMQATATELGLMNATTNQGIDLQVTLLDGTVFGTSGTSTQEFTGAGFVYGSESDNEDIAFVRLVFEGNVTRALLDSLFT